ncbi:MAG: MBL fold metallo-hydrolase [Burkholderiales bacterium]|jgi:L-ascorbate metabolism protein UlaG (beta-lactamase superfamily)|nr:MBL fold metallo-hydrolase [Burkholderiales bacterium]
MKSLGKRASGLRLERMQASPRWGGEGFRNVHPIQPGLRDSTERPSLGDFICADGRRTPAGPLPSANPLDAWRKPSDTGLRATWLGHSTVLIEIDGLRVLTDPVWGKRASPTQLAGPKRFQPVPLALKALPKLDAVVISHDHYDHLDYPTIKELVTLQDVPFITSLGVGAHLQAWGVPPERIVELDWWEHWQAPNAELRIHAAPSQHFSGRSLTDRNATLWSSIVIESPRHRVFFSGDTGLTSEYAAIRERFGPFDLVMLEVGAFHPSWGDIHLGPENALKAHQLLGGGAFLPVHWGTFSLALHDWDAPAETLLELGPKQGAQLLMPRLGEAVEPAKGEPAKPWWREADAPERARPQPAEPEDASKMPKAMPWPLD